MSILYEKYRPKKLDEYIGNQKLIIEIKQWLQNYYLEAYQKKSNNANSIIIGGPGIGKTTLATVILSELGFDVIEFNASDTRNAENIDNIFKDIFKNSKNISSLLNYETKKIAIIMDEIDGLSLGDKGGMKKLLYYLGKNNYFAPVILTSNISNYSSNGLKKLNELKKSCNIFTIETPPQFMLYNHFWRIVENEQMTEYITSPFLNILIQNACGDFRIIFNTLEMMRIHSKVKCLDLSNMMEYIKSFSCKDISYDIFQATEKIFNNKNINIDTIYTLFDLERYNLPINVFDSLYQNISQYSFDNIIIINNILNNYVDSIYYENALYTDLEWDLFHHHCTSTILSVFILFKTISHKCNTTVKSSRLLGKINSINANNDTRQRVANNYHMNSDNYHLYIELIVQQIISNPPKFRDILEKYDISKEELLRMVKSSDCKDRVLQLLKDIGIITQKECDRVS
jgi:DNA polymerase III delta prime subunit